jgi:hypothetical protein
MLKYSKQITTVLLVSIICLGSTYYCTESDRRYYEAFGQCVTSGGTVVPTGAYGNAMIACVKH